MKVLFLRERTQQHMGWHLSLKGAPFTMMAVLQSTIEGIPVTTGGPQLMVWFFHFMMVRSSGRSAETILWILNADLFLGSQPAWWSALMMLGRDREPCERMVDTWYTHNRSVTHTALLFLTCCAVSVHYMRYSPFYPKIGSVLDAFAQLRLI